MKKLLFLFIFIPVLLFSQETHYVFVDEMSYFPYSIAIEVGDQVAFTHGGVGVHDVNFTTNSITSEPFNNPVEITTLPAEGQYQSEPGLMGIITFDVPGIYNYDCSMYGHAAMGMVGSITVNEVNNSCLLSDGTFVPNGWSGSGVGNNWCNDCFCEDGVLNCSEMYCECLYNEISVFMTGGAPTGWTITDTETAPCDGIPLFECINLAPVGSAGSLENICIEDGCWAFNIYEAFGNSGIEYTIIDVETNEIIISTGTLDNEVFVSVNIELGEVCDDTKVSEHLIKKNVITKVDILGRDTNSKGFKIEIYDDGSVEKKYVIK